MNLPLQMLFVSAAGCETRSGSFEEKIADGLFDRLVCREDVTRLLGSRDLGIGMRGHRE